MRRIVIDDMGGRRVICRELFNWQGTGVSERFAFELQQPKMLRDIFKASASGFADPINLFELFGRGERI
ncbi:MAG: hypothetical protein WB792_10075 [Desulfobacterales bacterium]